MSTVKGILIIKLENTVELSCIVILKVTGRWRWEVFEANEQEFKALQTAYLQVSELAMKSLNSESCPLLPWSSNKRLCDPNAVKIQNSKSVL